MGDDDPKDRFKFISLIFLLHGFATLISWNMFINAHGYFVDYKLGLNYTQEDVRYNKYFLQYLTFASQLPNVAFTYVNCFVRIAGNMTLRVVGSLIIVVIVFLLTTIMAMVDTSSVPGFFFWTTMLSIVVMQVFNAIYQNCIMGVAAMFPPKFMGLVFVGNNACGTFASLLSITTIMIAGDLQTAAIYYFITAIFVLLAGLDSFLTLPLIKFYRHYKQLNDENIKDAGQEKQKIKYGPIIKKILVQLYNVFLNFAVTLGCFPAIVANIEPSDENFFIPKQYYALFMAFLTFNIFALIGSLLATLFIFPKPKWIWIIITLRVLFIPFFLMSNYRPGGKRNAMVFFGNDYVYFVVSVFHALTSGYYCSCCMQTIPGMVEPEYASNAGMMGGVALISGIFVGVMITFIWPPLMA